MFNVENYTSESGRDYIREYLEKLAKDNKRNDLNQILETVKNLSEYGPDLKKHFPKLVKHIEADLYELRPGRNRIFYFYFKQNGYVLLHAYYKKTREAPDRELNLARKRLKEYKRRNGA